jgi:hypothetical protein
VWRTILQQLSVLQSRITGGFAGRAAGFSLHIVFQLTQRGLEMYGYLFGELQYFLQIVGDSILMGFFRSPNPFLDILHTFPIVFQQIR